MAADTHLSQIAEAMAIIEGRFYATASGLHLKTEDAADFKRLAVEARSILDTELGALNNFSSNLLFVASGITGPSGVSKANVVDARKTIEGAINHIRRRPGLSQGQVAPSQPSFVSTSRLAELRHLPTSTWDFSRLVRLCEELNVTYAQGCYMAAAMLVRGIADHIPPIFGCMTFSEVANNYGGSRSFRGSMQHLEGSLRHIADACLHVQIRKTETLPNEAQIRFQSDLDVLLAEIVRISK